MRKSVPRVKDEEEEEYVEKTEKKQKKIITIQYSETDKKKNTAKVKHEAKIEKVLLTKYLDLKQKNNNRFFFYYYYC